MATTITTKKQRGMVILHHIEGDLRLIITELDDIEADIEYLYRNFPSKDLDEIGIGTDYLEALTSLNDLVKRFSKLVRSLASNHAAELGQDAVKTWKDKLEKNESDLGQYRREVRRNLADLNNGNVPLNPTASGAVAPGLVPPSTASSGPAAV